MDDLPIFKRFKEIMETIEYCLNARRILPALILLYTLIDSISWLSSDKLNDSVRKRFTRWVDKWMLRNGSLSCNSLELYAARCGVLHSLTSDSDLSGKGQVRRITYSFGNKLPSPLQKVSDIINPNEFVAIKVEDLYESFNLGLTEFLEEIIKDPQRKLSFESKAIRHFTYLNPAFIDEIISNLG